MQELATSEVWINGLECHVGRASLIVPADRVENIIEVRLSPSPPLARKWVGGLGIHMGKCVVSISLMPANADERSLPSRQTSGVLCRVAESEVGWMLEVAKVKSFIRVKPVKRAPQQANQQLPAWIGAAQTQDGRSVGLLDVELMVRELAGTA